MHSSTETRARWGALRHRHYRAFAAAGLVSTTGTWMQLVAQNWLVLRLTGEARAVGITVALQALPSVLLGIAGGVVADRFSKRHIVVVTQSMLAVLAAVLGVVTAAGLVTIQTVYCFALLLGLVMAVDGPTTGALGAELVPDADLGNALAIGSTANGLGRIVGMSIAGVLVATIGPGPIFVVNAASYLAVVFVVARLPAHLARRSYAEADESERAPRITRPWVVALACALAFFVSAFGRNYQVTMAAMSNSVFNAGAHGYGLLSVVFAAGALVGGLVAARVRGHRLRLVLTLAAAGSALQLASAFMPTLGSFALAIFPIAIFAVLFDTVTSCVVQLAAGHAYRGRAIAVLGTVSMLGMTIGGPSLGWIADSFGGRASLQCGATIVLAGIVVVVLLHALRLSQKARRGSVNHREIVRALVGVGVGN